MKMKATLIQNGLLLGGLLAIATCASAHDVVIEGTSVTQTVHCHDNSNLTVNGASNHIRATGHCNQIEVNGASVQVDAESVGTVVINGASVIVNYKTSPNKNGRAIVRSSGANSVVRKL